MRRAGRPRGAHDLIIAATAAAAGRTVVSADRRAFDGRGGRHLARALAVEYQLADRVAIGQGIWDITDATRTGVDLFGLPVEEAVFFLLTNLLVAKGLVLFLEEGPGAA